MNKTKQAFFVLSLALCLILSSCKKVEEVNFLVGNWNIEATWINTYLSQGISIQDPISSAQDSEAEFSWKMDFTFVEGKSTSDGISGKVHIQDNTYGKNLTGTYLWDKEKFILVIEIQYQGHPDWHGVVTCTGSERITPNFIGGELKVEADGNTTIFEMRGTKN